MLRYIIGAVVLAAFSYVGIGIERYYKERVVLLTGILEFVTYAEREISFLKRDLPSILKERSEGKGKIDKILLSVLDNVTCGNDVKIDSVYLNKNERRALELFFTALKKCDYGGRTVLFGNTIGELNAFIAKADKEKKEKGALIKKLMILAGVALLIIIV